MSGTLSWLLSTLSTTFSSSPTSTTKARDRSERRPTEAPIMHHEPPPEIVAAAHYSELTSLSQSISSSTPDMTAEAGDDLLETLRESLQRPSKLSSGAPSSLLETIEIFQSQKRMMSMTRSAWMGLIAAKTQQYADKQMDVMLKGVVRQLKKKLVANSRVDNALALLSDAFSLVEARRGTEGRDLFVLSQVIESVQEEGCMREEAVSKIRNLSSA